MDLAKRAGELVMIGFAGTTLGPAVAEQIQADGIGGVILFARNFESAGQVRALTGALQAMAPAGLPLLVATDQEGGVVSRLAGIGTDFPGNMALGATADALLVSRVATATARELLALGINLNLAPVVDVNNNPRNPVIGVRSYGSDPELVCELGGAAIRSYEIGGVLACAKHFPGHGDTDIDSHLALPRIPHDMERLWSVELRPYRRFAVQGIPAIMTAHVVVPALESDPDRPATLSSAVLTELLRKRLGFKGIIISDCLEMKAIADGVGTVRGAVESLKAGADLVLISRTPELQRAAVAAIRAAIFSGELPAEQVEASLVRLEAARRWVAQRQAPPLDVLRCSEHLALAERVAARAVTVLWDRAGLIPVEPAELGLIICRPALLTEVEEITPPPLLADLAEHELPRASVLVVDQRPSAVQVKAAAALAARCGTVVVATYGAVRCAEQGALVEALLAVNDRVGVLAQRDPYDQLALPPTVTMYMAAYENSPHMLRAALRVLTGRIAAQGVAPCITD